MDGSGGGAYQTRLGPRVPGVPQGESPHPGLKPRCSAPFRGRRCGFEARVAQQVGVGSRARATRVGAAVACVTGVARITGVARVGFDVLRRVRPARIAAAEVGQIDDERASAGSDGEQGDEGPAHCQREYTFEGCETEAVTVGSGSARSSASSTRNPCTLGRS
jgi:hypothetical protein